MPRIRRIHPLHGPALPGGIELGGAGDDGGGDGGRSAHDRRAGAGDRGRVRGNSGETVAERVEVRADPPESTLILTVSPDERNGRAAAGAAPGAQGTGLLAGPWHAVPWRTIIGAVGVVLAAMVLVRVLQRALTVVTLVIVAGFLAIVLAPVVRRVEPHVGGRRTVATAVVVLSSALGLLGLIALFVWPVRTQLIASITDLPGTVEQAGQGRGPLGRLVSEMDLDEYVRENEANLTRTIERLRGSEIQLVQLVVTAVIAFITVVVLAFAFLLQASNLAAGVLSVVPRRRQEAVRRVGNEIGHAISGYMIGNLFISLVAGTTAFICLLLLGVPSAIVLALWVAFADLIPLIGATLGAAVAVFAAFLHSPSAGVVALVFFIVYQQVENSVLQPAVMARTVKVNALIVLISVLLGVELFGIIGALLAIPVAGSIQIVVKAVRAERMRDRLLIAEEPAGR